MNPIKNKKDLEASIEEIKKFAYTYLEKYNPSKQQLKTYLFKHQLKKSFQYSLEWEKNQLAIWDNRSMLHQATAFKGNRIMHRITVQ